MTSSSVRNRSGPAVLAGVLRLDELEEPLDLGQHVAVRFEDLGRVDFDVHLGPIDQAMGLVQGVDRLAA